MHMIDSKILNITNLKGGSFVVSYSLTLPKRLLQELNTHGTLVKNAASMRAIPTKRFLQRANLQRPYWGSAQAGMQSGPGLHGWKRLAANCLHGLHKLGSKTTTKLLSWIGVHKQHSNPYVEPHVYCDAIVTFTERQVENFFSLRCGAGVEPDFCYLASLMLEDLLNIKGLYWEPRTEPRPTHIPELPPADRIHWPFGYDERLDLEGNLHANVAAAARASYMNHDKTFSPEANHKLHDRLLAERHMSPFEHVMWRDPHCRSRVGPGFCTYRHYLEVREEVLKKPLHEILREAKELSIERGYQYPER